VTEAADEFDIAIVGMAGRFPGARTLEQFWNNLAGGVESITRLTDDEILASGVPASYLGMPNYVKAAPVLDEPGHFAAAFFGFTPAEARVLDPQHRLLLEMAHEALEAAGCDPARFQGRIGVFAGSALNTYFTSVGLDQRITDDYIPTLIGNDKDFLATRISYKLNLRGPSITVQTACSTSLVAVHLARQGLLSGEMDVAVVGAISVRVPHRAGYLADSGGVVSPDGHVRAFDARANGTVFGSGGGVLVLKRLGDALAAGDPIRAVIKGSAVNNDGQAKAGYTAPSVSGQMDAVAEALANAGLPPDAISYVEAHGSGTPVGDPIEFAALTKAFRAGTQRSGFCAIGSVKTNVGHLDVAAGMAGIIKTVLSLEKRQIPPSLHFTEGNPEIDFQDSPFFVNTRLRDWTGDGARRAIVMATGMGGTNACLVLEEPPAPVASTPGHAPHLLVLSAKTEAALDAATRQLAEFLAGRDGLDMADVAFTLQVGRAAHRHRRYLVCTDQAGAAAALRETGTTKLRSGQATGARRPVVFMFPGIGDHYVGMGYDLYESQPVFREAVDQCARLLQAHLGVDIRTILYPASRSWQQKPSGKGIDLKAMLGNRAGAPADPDAEALSRTLHAQPALFTIEYATAKLWESLGIVPDAIVSHSMGEYVAACIAGVLSLEDATRLIARRAQLVNVLPEGSMLAVMMSEQELLPLLGPRLSISLINGPGLCVVAGPPDDVAELGRTLAERGIISRHVQNAHAFHSRMLDPIVEPFRAEVQKARLGEPTIPYTSNVTGTWITPQEARDPAYWGRHANQTARFSDALQALWQLKDPILVEIGPGRTLGVLAMQHPGRAQAGEPTVVASIRPRYENESDAAVLLHAVGQLWIAGLEVRWESLYPGERRRRVVLPTYPFERQEFWVRQRAGEPEPSQKPGTSSRTPIERWFHVPSWEREPLVVRNEPDLPTGRERWVVFADRWGGGRVFCRALEARGAHVHLVRFGNAFGRGADGSFEINPAQPGDYDALLRELGNHDSRALNVVHLGCLTRDGEPTDDTALRRKQDFGFFSLLYLGQAIQRTGSATPVRIGVVTNRLHDVNGAELLDPDMAPVMGPCMVLPREMPNVSCFAVDLPDARNIDDLQDDEVAHCLAEFGQPGNHVIAYRGRHRWRRTYRPVTLPAADASALPRLRDGGVYLITGGTGGLGLAFATHLARTCRARIILTRRSAFPPKASWPELLRSPDLPPATRRILEAITEMERLGGEVDVCVAEASDRQQMQRIIGDTLARYGALHGVFHAAGAVTPSLLANVTTGMAERVLAPKVQGTRILFDLLRGIEPDFLVLFSSMSSVTGPYAHGDYSAANWYLDAFAAYANAQSRMRTLAINWPVWKEAGIGVEGAYSAQLEAILGVEHLQEAMLERAMPTADGLEAFSRALCSGFPQVVVSPDPLDILADPGRPASGLRGPLDSARGAAPEVLAATSDSAEADRPTNDIEAEIQNIWLAAFGHEQIGIHQEFADLGGHSLIAMQIVAKIKALYHVDMSLRDFFSAPTIAGLAALVERLVLEEIEGLSDDEAGQMVRAMQAEVRSDGLAGEP
jgi:acyl transferase domain-containing protein/acyl carrier protein